MTTFSIEDAEALGCQIVRREEPALIEYRKGGAAVSFGGGCIEDALAQVEAWHVHRVACGAVDVVAVQVVSG